jgi:dTDP-4-dehydrorhamnose reductase
METQRLFWKNTNVRLPVLANDMSNAKKILIFGKTGQLGWEVQRTLASLGDIFVAGSDKVDLSQMDGVRNLIREIKPNIIVNTSAYTAVDRAESEPELAMAVNAKSPGVMAEEAHTLGAVLIHFSTDYVFDGKKGKAYTEEDTTNPLNVYGHSKLLGEQAISQVGGAHVILRTSWVYSLRGDGFVSKILSWSRRQQVLKIVSDQIGSPTWARMLAEVTAMMIARGLPDPYAYFLEKNGVYHLGGAGEVSRYDFAQMILRLDPHPEEQVVTYLESALTTEFPTPALRPLFTSLDCSRLEHTFGLGLPKWEEALGLALGK